jgi:hypothetical protein
MVKPFYVSLKDLIADYPADWLAFLDGPSVAVTAIDSDLATITAAADKVLRVAAEPPWLLHVELQSSPHSDPAEPLHWYNTLLGHQHRLLVRTVLVLLRREADSPQLDGLYQKAFAGEPAYLQFRYRVVRVWQMPASVFLEGGLGLLPLAPLADIIPDDLPGLIRRMQARLVEEAVPEQARQLWTTTFILMGLRYDAALAEQLVREVQTMEESVTYQAIIHKGLQQGLQQGKLHEIKQTVLRQGRKRFGEPPASTVTALEAISDLERLERMSEHLLDVATWDDLLATA